MNILNLIIIISCCMIIASFNSQSSSAVSNIEEEGGGGGGDQNNSQHNPEINNSSLSKPQQDKFAILNFDDGWKNHYKIVKPILDKYNFKATFYNVCNYVEAGENVDEDKEDNARMNWNEIRELKNDGIDIGSHTMNHEDLEGLSYTEIEYEIGESKKCLIDQGINATTFAYPFSSGTYNEFVINTISKYYDLGRSGGSTLMFLHCDEWPNKSDQKNCRTFNENGELNQVSRYSLLRWAHQNDRGNNDQELYDNFIEFVNSQIQYNTPKDNSDQNSSPLSVLAIPIIVYHNVADESEGKLTISSNLLEKEIKYLYDNHFKIKTMSDLKYNSTKDFLYIRD
ncbi:MAG: polysaccharide deacetylase family protein [Candidatus Nitrosocosmicus sp.]|nr:polysaccharide deacetylase family protein [Candidatus Nitrosocosmicus sp.]